jgi:hypothetical protein
MKFHYRLADFVILDYQIISLDKLCTIFYYQMPVKSIWSWSQICFAILIYLKLQNF